jgi:hypothetical protein
MTAELKRWVGWIRSEGRSWKVVLHAETESACWSKLLAVKVAGQRVDLEVLPVGRAPGDRAGLTRRVPAQRDLFGEAVEAGRGGIGR